MARLGTYYGLCPLIDHRSLLGITQDVEPGCVIVTLGKNISIKFKLSDQKQLYSWSTKDKYSSPIIYDKEQGEYVAVFNDSFIRTWNDESESIDKIKKLKFRKKIHTIINFNEQSFIVFKNGAISTLSEALTNRRDYNPDDEINVEEEYINDIVYTTANNLVYFGLVIKSTLKTYLLWTTFNQNERGPFFTMDLQRGSFDLIGLIFHVDKGTVNLLTLWNDSRMFSTELDPEAQSIGELFSVIESIACKDYVSMISLDENYIAMYGCNSNEEGALLVIYSMQFKVVQTKQPFKLFTNGAKLWKINESLLFPVGQNLAVIPFYLDTEQLAALVGSHRVIETTSDSDMSVVQTIQFVNWDKTVKTEQQKVPEDPLEAEIQEFLIQGLSKPTIFDTLLLEIIEKEDLEKLRLILDYFSDISESGLVRAINFLMNLEPKAFRNKALSSEEGFPEKIQPIERVQLLDIIFTKNFNDSLLLLSLRSVLSLDNVLILLSYIQFALSKEDYQLPSFNNIQTEEKLLHWSCILLDANYQKIVLTRDTHVAQILTSLRNQIKEEINSLEDLEATAALINEIQKGRDIQKKSFITATDYTIEDLRLYN